MASNVRRYIFSGGVECLQDPTSSSAPVPIHVECHMPPSEHNTSSNTNLNTVPNCEVRRQCHASSIQGF